jgi:hypothetical protein
MAQAKRCPSSKVVLVSICCWCINDFANYMLLQTAQGLDSAQSFEYGAFDGLDEVGIKLVFVRHNGIFSWEIMIGLLAFQCLARNQNQDGVAVLPKQVVEACLSDGLR